MALQYSLATPGCGGINHADFSIDGRFAIFTCEFSGGLAKIDLVDRSSATLKLSRPTDVLTTRRARKVRARRSESARRRHAAGRPRLAGRQATSTSPTCTPTACFVVDGARFKGDGLHRHRQGHARPLSRAATARSSTSPTAARNAIHGMRNGPGSVSVVDFATRQVMRHLAHSRRRQPRHGQRQRRRQDLWLSGRYDNVVYAIDTTSGEAKIKVGHEPHGLAVWPQPGRYSLGHTGNMR